jgi:hypothetical protein
MPAPSNYTSTINYYRVNANNTAIATTNAGTDPNLNPSEEILAPESAGTYDTTSTGVTITGEAGSLFNNLAVNQYLYYTDNSGNYILLGQIEVIGGNTSITLYNTRLVTPPAGATLSGAFALITNTEPLYMRISTEINGTAGTGRINMPDFSFWRTSSNVTSGTNDTTVTQWLRVSDVGTPVSIAAATQNIPFTIQTMNQFTATSPSGAFYFQSTAVFPSFVWIKIVPTISSENNSLASKTMYRLTTQETINCINFAPQVAVGILQAAGYNISGGTGGGGGTGQN